MGLVTSLNQLSLHTIERACSGDRGAVGALVGALQKPFFNLAVRMLGDRATAEDATQECLFRVITHLSQYRAEAKFSTWATRIAVNAIFDFRSGMARTARYGFPDFVAGLAASRDESAIERPEDALALKEAKTICSRALLQCLDGDHRIAFVLGEILELDSLEAAQVLEIEPAAFRKRLSRARADVTAVLSRECSVHSTGNPCACHKVLGRAVETGQVALNALEARIADLEQLRRRLTVLQAEPRTREMYLSDETPDLREDVLAKVRMTLFQMAN